MPETAPPESLTASKRLRQIIAVLRKHSFIANFHHQTHPEEVVAAFEELGPTFIKLGQLLSTRPDLVSPAYIKALTKLQDRVASDDFATIAATFEEATGQTISEAFADFEETPFASASIGQCHYAHLKDGTKVVVKVQHPAVRQLVEVDLNLFSRAVALLKYVPTDSVVDLPEVVNQLSAALKTEIDTRQEAAFGEKFYRLNNGRGPFLAPQVYQDHCASRVLVTEAMAGQSIKGLLTTPPTVALPAECDLATLRQQVATDLVQNFIQQVFDDHFFHADPHPGNLLFFPAPAGEAGEVESKQAQVGPATVAVTTSKPRPPYRLVYLDFGMMGTLSEPLADGIAQVILAIAAKDNYQLSQAILAICNQTGPVDEQAFNHELAAFLRPYLKTVLTDLDFPQLIFEITRLCRENHLQVKPEVTMLLRAFATLEGTVTKLYPTLSMMDVALPFARKWLKEHFNLKHSLQNQGLQAYKAGQSLLKLPVKAATFLDQLTNGEQRLNLHYRGQDKVLAQLERMLNRLLTVIILAAVILASAILVATGHDHPPIYWLGVAGYLVAVVVIIGLVISNLVRRWRHRG